MKIEYLNGKWCDEDGLPMIGKSGEGVGETPWRENIF